MTKSKSDEDKIWDRANREDEQAWAEMDEFIKALEARGPASTPEQKKQDRERFQEILKRCSDRSQAIFERASAGYPPAN